MASGNQANTASVDGIFSDNDEDFREDDSYEPPPPRR